MSIAYLVFGLIICITLVISVQRKKLTGNAALAASVIGCFIYMGTGFAGIAMIGSFFILGNLATSWKLTAKELIGAAEHSRGQRTVGQVLANGGISGVLGLIAFFLPAHQPFMLLLVASSLSAATADTLSSELGTIYGKRFYNILDFRRGPRGENGVVSLDGTLTGILGSAIIGSIYSFSMGWGQGFWLIIAAGTIGNIADSVLGATLEKKGYLQNNTVNLLNTLVGASAAYLLRLLFD
jgi:uncharacterized protein (TIGR00297 family)